MNDGFNNQGGFGGQNNAFPNGLNNQQPMMDPNMMNQGMMNQQGMDPNMMQQGMMNQQPAMDPSMMQQQPMMDPNMMNQGMMNQQGMDPNMMQQQPMMDPNMMQQGMMNQQGMDPNMMQQQPMMDQNMMNQQGMDPNMMNQGMMNQQGMDPNMMQQQPMMDQNMMQQGMMNQQGMDPNMMQQQPMMNQGMQPGMMNGNFNQQSVPLKYRIANLFNFRNKRNMIILIPIVMVAIVLLIIIITLLTTRTLKCSNTETNSQGVTMETTIKVKYKFGHINTRYEERVIDYAKSDVDNDTIESDKDQYREMMADTCKKSDGCTYTFKAKKKKIVINMRNEYDKKARLDLEEYYPTYSDFKDAFNDACKSEK